MADIQIIKNNATSLEAKVNIRQGERIRTAGTGNWRYEMAVLIMSNVVNDSAVVVVDGGHLIAPHGEAPTPRGFPSGMLCLAIAIDADDYDEGTHTVQDNVSVKRHEDHFDVWKLEVTFDVSSAFFADSITKLQATLTAEHVEERPRTERPENPPEPIDSDLRREIT
ncbi:MAG: hypothetical protein AB3N14_10825 [Flavobacteriaceae bacterium]